MGENAHDAAVLSRDLQKMNNADRPVKKRNKICFNKFEFVLKVSSVTHNICQTQ